MIKYDMISSSLPFVTLVSHKGAYFQKFVKLINSNISAS